MLHDNVTSVLSLPDKGADYAFSDKAKLTDIFYSDVGEKVPLGWTFYSLSFLRCTIVYISALHSLSLTHLQSFAVLFPFLK